jgi:hypothetical protein
VEQAQLAELNFHDYGSEQAIDIQVPHGVLNLGQGTEPYSVLNLMDVEE